MKTKKQETAHKTVLTAMMMCIIILSIVVLRIPIPLTQGYVNLSDAVIFTSMFFLDRKHCVIAASLGSMMGDILCGFAFWAPWSFFIKGGMALIATGMIAGFEAKNASGGKISAYSITSMTAGGLFMTAGYFIAERVMYGSWAVAALGVPWNIGQFTIGIAVASAITSALVKAGVKTKDN